MIEHNPSAYEDGFDAFQSGYDDAIYDGLDLVSEIACQCDECRKAYADGQEAAIAEIFSKNVNPDN